jgi:hypothetical protein
VNTINHDAKTTGDRARTEWHMDVKQIVSDYLKAHGFDGLSRDACDPCGCGIDDLFPCDSCPDECNPGYRRTATQDDIDNHSYDGDVGDVIYTTEKPDAAPDVPDAGVVALGISGVASEQNAEAIRAAERERVSP